MSAENVLRATGGGEAYARTERGTGVYVVIRFGDGISRLSDFDDIRARGDIHVVVLNTTNDGAEHLRATYNNACAGDALLVYVDSPRSYRLAMKVLQMEV